MPLPSHNSLHALGPCVYSWCTKHHLQLWSEYYMYTLGKHDINEISFISHGLRLSKSLLTLLCLIILVLFWAAYIKVIVNVLAVSSLFQWITHDVMNCSQTGILAVLVLTTFPCSFWWDVIWRDKDICHAWLNACE